MPLDPDSQEELFEAIAVALEALGATVKDIVGSEGLYRMSTWDLLDLTVIQTANGPVTVKAAGAEPIAGERFLELAQRAIKSREAAAKD